MNFRINSVVNLIHSISCELDQPAELLPQRRISLFKLLIDDIHVYIHAAETFEHHLLHVPSSFFLTLSFFLQSNNLIYFLPHCLLLLFHLFLSLFRCETFTAPFIFASHKATSFWTETAHPFWRVLLHSLVWTCVWRVFFWGNSLTFWALWVFIINVSKTWYFKNAKFSHVGIKLFNSLKLLIELRIKRVLQKESWLRHVRSVINHICIFGSHMFTCNGSRIFWSWPLVWRSLRVSKLPLLLLSTFLNKRHPLLKFLLEESLLD